MDLKDNPPYTLSINGDSVDLMQTSFMLVPGQYRLIAKSYSYLPKDTTVLVNTDNSIILVPMTRDPSYVAYEKDVRRFKIKERNNVWIPIIVTSTGFAVSAGLWINSTRYDTRKRDLESKYQQTGPDILSIENVKQEFEDLKTQTVNQWKAAIITASVSTVSSLLVLNNRRKFYRNNKRPIYIQAPELSIDFIDDEMFFGLTYKMNF